jgi:ribonuclease HII
MRSRFTIGIDEVGRGPIAGPVTVCACMISSDIAKKYKGIKDSKKLSEKKREEIFSIIKNEVQYQVTSISAKEIDKKGISFCIKKALATSISIFPTDTLVLLDGGLKAPLEFKHQKTIIKGDEKEVCIAFASIIAKVTRDRYMQKMAKKHPQYGFEGHKGYGTKAHYLAIEKSGKSSLHRLSFLQKTIKPV